MPPFRPRRGSWRAPTARTGASIVTTPDVTALMTIEMSEHEEGTPTRFVTRGLRKVGVADLVMSNVSSMDEGAMVTAVNAVAQAIVK